MPSAPGSRAVARSHTLDVGKLIIDEVVLLVQAPGAFDSLEQSIGSGLLNRIGWLLLKRILSAVDPANAVSSQASRCFSRRL